MGLNPITTVPQQPILETHDEKRFRCTGAPGMNEVVSVYAVCVVVLFCKMFGLSCYQGYFRLRGRAFTNPEDAAVFNRRACAQERPQVSRAARAWANDLENIPLFFTLAGLAIVLNTPALATSWLILLFTAARVLHSLAYLACLQPWRTLAYGIGVICLAGLALMIVAQVTTADVMSFAVR